MQWNCCDAAVPASPWYTIPDEHVVGGPKSSLQKKPEPVPGPGWSDVNVIWRSLCATSVLLVILTTGAGGSNDQLMQSGVGS